MWTTPATRHHRRQRRCQAHPPGLPPRLLARPPAHLAPHCFLALSPGRPLRRHLRNIKPPIKAPPRRNTRPPSRPHATPLYRKLGKDVHNACVKLPDVSQGNALSVASLGHPSAWPPSRELPHPTGQAGLTCGSPATVSACSGTCGHTDSTTRRPGPPSHVALAALRFLSPAGFCTGLSLTAAQRWPGQTSPHFSPFALSSAWSPGRHPQSGTSECHGTDRRHHSLGKSSTRCPWTSLGGTCQDTEAAWVTMWQSLCRSIQTGGQTHREGWGPAYSTGSQERGVACWLPLRGPLCAWGQRSKGAGHRAAAGVRPGPWAPSRHPFAHPTSPPPHICTQFSNRNKAKP